MSNAYSRENGQIRSRVQKFPAWHTKTAPNGKCCEGYIVPSRVTSSQMWKVCWNKGRLCWKNQSCFISVTLKSLSGRKLLDLTTYIEGWTNTKCIQNFFQENLKKRNQVGVYGRILPKRICVKRNAGCRLRLCGSELEPAIGCCENGN